MEELISTVVGYFSENPLAQAFGFISLFLVLSSMILKNEKFFLILLAIASVFSGMQYFLLGAINGAIISGIDIFKNLIFIKFKKNNIIFAVLFLAYLSVSLYVIFKATNINVFSFFPIIASTTSLIAIAFFRAINIKIAYIFVGTLWLVHDIYYHALFSIVTSILVITTAFIGAVRIYFEEKQKISTKSL